MNVDTVPRTLAIATIVAIVCSALVASSVTILRPIQIAQTQLERNHAIVTTAGRLLAEKVSDREIVNRYLDLEAHVVDIATGDYAPDRDARSFDHWEANTDTSNNHVIADEFDTAGLETRATQAPIYLVRKSAALERVVLPVHGRAMWSTVYGYVALDPDLVTIADIVFFRHGETAGIGDRIQDPSWYAQWRGKRIYDENGELRIDVVKGAQGPYQVDLISGASVTSDAAGNIVRYWFSDDGYRTLLDQLREREGL